MSNPTSIELNSLNFNQPTPVPSRITRPQTDLEAAGQSGSRDEIAVIQVIDAPFDGRMPQDRARFSFDDKNVKDSMKSLPRHEPGTARILDITVHSDFMEEGLRNTQGPQSTQEARDALIDYLSDTYTTTLIESRRIFRWLSDPLLVNDIGSISAQWTQSLSGGGNYLYRLVNRTSLQQHPLDDDVHPRESYLTCAQASNNRLIVIIVNDVWDKQSLRTNKSSDKPTKFRNPRNVLTIKQGDSLTSFSDGTLNTFAKLLVLDFFQASIYLQTVDYYETLILPQLSKKNDIEFSLAKNPHLQVTLGLFEPRLSATSKEAFKEIEDAEGILRSVNNLVDSIKFVVAALKQNNLPGPQQADSNDYDNRMQNLKRLYSERCENAKRALEALERQLDYLTKRHAIREAKAIRVLTILASFYLPLSLAASVLGMQTPFRKVAYTVTKDDQDLGGTNLLFDFFGVFVGLACVTIWITYGIRFGVSLKANGLNFLSKKPRSAFHFFQYGRRWRYGGQGGRIFGWVRIFTAVWLGVGMSVALPVIFWFGMMGSAQKAWDWAKWMFTAYAVIGGLLLICYVATYWILYYRRIRPQRTTKPFLNKPSSK